MFQLERLYEIENYINQKGRANIAELSDAFQVSKVTIRRDIDTLEAQGRVVKTYGGALSVKSKINSDIPHEKKILESVEEKQRIGAKAASLIENNDTVIIDTGTTTLNIIKNITAKNVTIITHDLLVAMEVIKHRCAELIVIGGTWQSASYALIGNQTIDMYKRMHVDKVYIGCDAIDIDFGVSNRLISAIEVKQIELEVANQAILLADSSKFGKKAFYSLYPVSRLDTIITDRISDEYRDYCSNNNISVILAE